MDYFLLVIPDFLFEKLDTNKNNGFTKVEIEEEMLIKEVSKWKKLLMIINFRVEDKV